MSLGEKLTALLFDKRISRRRLAEDLNISYSALSNYLRDYREPSLEIVARAAGYFGVSVDYLLNARPPFQTAPPALTVDEQRLLRAYNVLDDAHKKFLLEQTKLLAGVGHK